MIWSVQCGSIVHGIYSFKYKLTVWCRKSVSSNSAVVSQGPVTLNYWAQKEMAASLIAQPSSSSQCNSWGSSNEVNEAEVNPGGSLHCFKLQVKYLI